MLLRFIALPQEQQLNQFDNLLWKIKRKQRTPLGNSTWKMQAEKSSMYTVA